MPWRPTISFTAVIPLTVNLDSLLEDVVAKEVAVGEVLGGNGGLTSANILYCRPRP